MSVFNGSDPSTIPTRELRRLGHSMVVATSYVNRGVDRDSSEDALAAAVRQGYESGYAEGLAQAATDNARFMDEEAQRVATALVALSRAAGAIQELDLRLRGEMQGAAAKLAFALLKELLARETQLALNPGCDAITRVLALDEGTQPATVRMNPVDVATLGEAAASGLGRAVCVVPDSAVEPGGALVEIGRATLDGQLSTALERVRQVLLNTAERSVDDDRAA